MWFVSALFLTAFGQESEVTEDDLAVSCYFTANWKDGELRVNFWAYRRLASPFVLEYFIPAEVSVVNGIHYYAVPDGLHSPLSGVKLDNNTLEAVGSPFDGMQVTMPVSILPAEPHGSFGHIYQVDLLQWRTCEGPECVNFGFGI